jgi:hypothetical protein
LRTQLSRCSTIASFGDPKPGSCNIILCLHNTARHLKTTHSVLFLVASESTLVFLLWIVPPNLTMLVAVLVHVFKALAVVVLAAVFLTLMLIIVVVTVPVFACFSFTSTTSAAGIVLIDIVVIIFIVFIFVIIVVVLDEALEPFLVLLFLDRLVPDFAMFIVVFVHILKTFAVIVFVTFRLDGDIGRESRQVGVESRTTPNITD